jgi:superfamily II DNA or RNA helicase
MDKLDIQALKKYSLEDLSLRDYQQENKQKVYDAWESTNSVMLQMPTGTGKTRLFVSIINDFIRIGKEKGEDITHIAAKGYVSP